MTPSSEKPKKRRQRLAKKGTARKPGRRGRRSKRRTSRWEKALYASLVFLLAGPTLVILLYSFLAPPVTPLMVIRLAEGEAMDYRWQPLERISPHLPLAVIASEDNRFCEHWGFDFTEFQNIFEDWRAGGQTRGASTISMQTTKNILLWPGRSIARKIIEAWLTPQLELYWSKRRILEVYLNVAEFGSGVYGVGAASELYFSKPASALELPEACVLAAVLPNPVRLSAADPSDYVRGRALDIQEQVRLLGGTGYLDSIQGAGRFDPRLER
jgi:monofunctional biosynthetic peptidoglycan transglycosylase